MSAEELKKAEDDAKAEEAKKRKAPEAGEEACLVLSWRSCRSLTLPFVRASVLDLLRGVRQRGAGVVQGAVRPELPQSA